MERKQSAPGANAESKVRFQIVNLLLLFSFFLVSSKPSYAVNDAGNRNWMVKNPFEKKMFIENKGQFNLPESCPKEEILFGANLDGLNYYFGKNNIWISHINETELDQAEGTHSKSVGKSEEDGDEVPTALIEQIHQIRFVGAGVGTVIIPEIPSEEAFTFGSAKGISARAYKKLIYQNLYPGIDLEFYFPFDKQGFKYNFIIHPDSDPSAIIMSYPLSKGLQFTSEGSLIIESPFGNFQDHLPSANELESGSSVQCSFFVSKGQVHFNTGSYDHSRTLFIDPWTTTPVFTGSSSAFDVDWDDAGNCYVYGGAFPFQVIKYNSSGVALWTYTTSFTSTKKRYGDFAVDRRTGSIYIVEGYNPTTGAAIIKLFTNGSVAKIFPGNSSFTEMWRLTFSSCTNQLVIAGGGVTSPSYTACYLDTNLVNLSPVNVLNSATGYHDMWGVAADNSGNCYMATAQSISSPTMFDNLLFSLPLPSLSPANWQTPSGYKFVETYGVSYTPGSLTGYSNGYNGMCMGGTGLYTYDSHLLQKWNTSNGSVSGSVTVNGPIIKNARRYGGITADQCDHLFLGLGSSIEQYNSLTFAGSIPAPDTIYDLNLGKNNILYACGKGFISAIQLNITPCNGIIVTDHLQNCQNPGSDSLSISGGTPPYTITWNTVPIQTGPVAANLAPGTYVATIQDQACTVDTKYDTIIIPVSTFQAKPLVHDISCNGGTDGSVLLQISGAGTPGPTYSWSTGANSSSVSNLSAGNYSVTIHTASGCIQTLNVNLTEPPPIICSPAYGLVKCHGDTTGISLTITGGTPDYLVSWNTSPVKTGPSLHGILAGNYSASVIDQNGCTKIFSVVVQEPTALTAILTASDTGCTDNKGTASVLVQGGTGAYSYSWYPGGSIAPGITQMGSGSYTVIIQDSCGCKVSYTTESIPCDHFIPEVSIYLPNTFTPNDDGLNDFFIPKGEGIETAGYSLLIFNRWGTLIWESHSPYTGWDGRPTGGNQVVQEDVYVWKLDCRDILGVPHHLIGHVNVIK